MVKAEHVPELLALLSEHEILSCFLNSGHYVIKIDARFGDYERLHEEHLEIWLTGNDDESAELGLSFVFDLVRNRMQGIRKKLRKYTNLRWIARVDVIPAEAGIQ